MSDTRDSVTITFTSQQYLDLCHAIGSGYKFLQQRHLATPELLERLDQLRAHILSADLFESVPPTDGEPRTQTA